MILAAFGRRLLKGGEGCSLLPRLATFLTPMILAGCSMHAHSPTMSLYGSFFPVWLIAALLGVICSVILRLLFIRVGLHAHLPMSPLTYLSAAIFSGIMIWALWTGALTI
ncbi:hypothetical protein J4377_14955 [Halomonas sp. XH26]|nr:hypothetical protein CUU95_09470 [Halomonas alkaliphila]UTA79234.1 hypothetical protein J4377_14955 [Halomonas sp. XH26]